VSKCAAAGMGMIRCARLFPAVSSSCAAPSQVGKGLGGKGANGKEKFRAAMLSSN